MKKTIILLGILCILSSSIQAQIYMDPSYSVEERIDDLIPRMSLDEKLGQMIQPANEFLIDGQVTSLYVGSVLAGGNSLVAPNTVQGWADEMNKWQAEAMATPLQIPVLFGVDAVHGHNNVENAVIFPHNVGLGAANDPELMYRIGQVTAKEVAATGWDWTFAPCLAVARNEWWGRAYESFGEDPDIIASLSGEYVRGLQGTNYQGDNILACAKHFIGDGGTVPGTGDSGYNLDQGDTQITYQELMDIHMPGYLETLQEDVQTVMISYSSFTGVKMHMQKGLITDVLKGELGFDGLIVSDWDAIHQLPGTYADQVFASVDAGIDLFMESANYATFVSTLRTHVLASNIKMPRIDDAVRRILRIKFRAGLFENPYIDTADNDGSFGSPAHRAVAREAVRKSAVLLKNTGILPLSTNMNVIVAGRLADDLGALCGGWTISWQGGNGDQIDRGDGVMSPLYGTNILQGIQHAIGTGGSVSFDADGSDASTALHDVAVVVVGEDPYAEGVGDNTAIPLDPTDVNYLNTVAASGVPMVVILVSGRPLIVTGQIDDWDAFVAAWLPGTQGEGIADLLFGKYDFTGTLPVSWPVAASDEPINIGDASYTPLFAYGEGLSVSETVVIKSNLAYLKPATASSIEGGGYEADQANDGNMVTRWSSAASDPQWWEVDLGQIYDLGEIVIYWEAAYSTDYDISVSTNGVDWTVVGTEADGAGGTVSMNISNRGQYVRFDGYARATIYGHSFYEFQVYEYDDTPPPPAPGTLANVTNITAQAQLPDRIALSWDTSSVSDFDHTVILRKTGLDQIFVDASTNQGDLVYAGSLTSFTDALPGSDVYTYRFLAVSSNGSTSPGVQLSCMISNSKADDFSDLNRYADSGWGEWWKMNRSEFNDSRSDIHFTASGLPNYSMSFYYYSGTGNESVVSAGLMFPDTQDLSALSVRGVSFYGRAETVNSNFSVKLRSSLGTDIPDHYAEPVVLSTNWQYYVLWLTNFTAMTSTVSYSIEQAMSNADGLVWESRTPNDESTIYLDYVFLFDEPAAEFVDTNAPPAPMLVSPTNNTFSTNPNPVFTWTEVADVSGINKYYIELNSTLYSSPSASFSPGFLTNGDYSWRVYAEDNFGNAGEWSTNWLITVNTNPLPPANAVDFTAVDAGTGGTLYLSWTIPYATNVRVVSFNILSGDRDHHIHNDENTAGVYVVDDASDLRIGDFDQAGPGNDFNYHSYLSFPLASIPTNAVVNSAYVYLKRSGNNGTAFNNPFQVDHIVYGTNNDIGTDLDDRYNVSVTRSNIQPAFFTFNDTDVPAAGSVLTVSCTTQVGYALSNAKQFQQDGTDRVFQVMIRDNLESVDTTGYLEFYSSEDGADGPKLSVNYTIIEPDGNPSGYQLVRKMGSAPIARSDGLMIMSNMATAFTDTGLLDGQTYYYGLYSYNWFPTFSSGVFTSGIPTGGTSAALSASSIVEQVSLNGLPSAPVPGASMDYLVRLTNLSVITAQDVLIYTELESGYVLYVSNSEASSPGWVMEWSTNTLPDQDLLSSDYSVFPVSPESIRWVRWRKDDLPGNTAGELRYRVYVK